ncbi:MAG TPA: hypothetical protein VGN34_24990, partial [Ktedonobacteraceae bacterium]
MLDDAHPHLCKRCYALQCASQAVSCNCFVTRNRLMTVILTVANAKKAVLAGYLSFHSLQFA